MSVCKRFFLLLLVMLSLPALAPAEGVPYLQKVKRPDEMIFAGPSYDEICVGTVMVKGTFTIVEEADDGEGHLWGRLKSGAGWIDLTHIRSEEVAAWPVSAAFSHDCPVPEGSTTFCMEDSEYTTLIAFRAYEPLTDVALVSLDMAADAAPIPAEVLALLPDMSQDAPLLAGVVFYGDMTTYGLSFTDADGRSRLFAVSISGRNGMLILEELPVLISTNSP